MSLEIWQAMPTLDESELQPIISNLADWPMVEKVTAQLGLGEDDSITSTLLAHAQSFNTGRLVVVDALQPDAIERRLTERLSEDRQLRWFTADEFILQILRNRTQVCYGGWRDSIYLRVFGQ